MNPITLRSMRSAWLAALVLVSAALLAFLPAQRAAHAQDAAGAKTFAESVDLRPLGTIAVQSDGRIKSMSSFANEMMGYVSGPRKIAGQTPLFTYFDMLFRPDAYRDADAIFVKGSGPRKRIVDRVLTIDGSPEMRERMRAFEESGLISETLLLKPEVVQLLREMRQDLIRTAKVVDAVDSAITVKSPRFLLSKLRIVPRGDGDLEQQWHGIDSVMFADG